MIDQKNILFISEANACISHDATMAQATEPSVALIKNKATARNRATMSQNMAVV